MTKKLIWFITWQAAQFTGDRSRTPPSLHISQHALLEVTGLPPTWGCVCFSCYFQNWLYNKTQQGWQLDRGEGQGTLYREATAGLN